MGGERRGSSWFEWTNVRGEVIVHFIHHPMLRRRKFRFRHVVEAWKQSLLPSCCHCCVWDLARGHLHKITIDLNLEWLKIVIQLWLMLRAFLGCRWKFRITARERFFSFSLLSIAIINPIQRARSADKMKTTWRLVHRASQSRWILDFLSGRKSFNRY